MSPATSPVANALDVALPPRPYPGLRPFNTNEWRIFCGRETVTRDVMLRLGENNVVLVHGGSGCGKSSLIAAGVLPSLQRDLELDGELLVSATIRPNQGPLAALAQTLANLLGPVPDLERRPDTRVKAVSRTDAAAWTSALLFAPDIVERIEAAIAAKGIDILCLVIDQFEEIFAWARERRVSDVEAMCRLLAALARPGAGQRLIVIATMRSDFLGQCAQFPALGRVINTCQYFLNALDDRMVERAIRDPAALFGGSVDDALVTRLKTEANGALDALPVLQHALMRMAARKQQKGWREPWRVTLDDYRDVIAEPEGGSAPPGLPGNALSVHAEEIRAELVAGDPATGAAVECVFRGLFDTDGERLIRRPTFIDQLTEMAGSVGPQVTLVVDAFAREGNDLLVKITDSETGKTIVDISHEALLRNWWRMKFAEHGEGAGWIKAEQDDALVWRTLALMASGQSTPLDKHQLARFDKTIARFFEAPAKATRYFTTNDPQGRAEDQPEWRSVAELIALSRRRIRNRRWMIGVAFLIGVSLVSYLALTEITARERRERDIAGIIASQNARLVTAGESINDQIANADAKPLSEGETALIQLVNQAKSQEAGSPSSGYIWIGGESTTNLRATPSGAPLESVRQVRSQATYFLAANVALRASLPDARNRSDRLAALMVGTPVLALGEPQRADNGQFWLQIRPIQDGTVFIQYDGGDPTPAVMRLRAAGFQVPKPERLESASGKAEVRYCRESDIGIAKRAAAAFTKELRGKPLSVRWIGEDRACLGITAPGTVEVWVGDAG